jgi:hypothetical protein
MAALLETGQVPNDARGNWQTDSFRIMRGERLHVDVLGG